MKKALLLTAFVSTAVFGFTAPNSYSVRGYYNFGEIDGFVQIPRGGQFNTTSDRRPTFKELGIEDIQYPELSFQANWDKFSLYGEVEYLKFDGKANLGQELITHSHTIPAGSEFKTNHKYIHYNFGGYYNWYSNGNLTISPLCELSMTQFEYKYNSNSPTTKISGKRAFGWGQVNLGVLSKYKFTDNYSVEFKAKAGIPYDSVREFYQLSLINKYNIYSKDNKNLNLLAGIEYEKLEYRDTQHDMQNFMSYTISPIYKVGLELEF